MGFAILATQRSAGGIFTIEYKKFRNRLSQNRIGGGMLAESQPQLYTQPGTRKYEKTYEIRFGLTAN